ncbi:MAG: hypothetical protein AAF251_16070 [Pseudomonadota bacterium]
MTHKDTRQDLEEWREARDEWATKGGPGDPYLDEDGELPIDEQWHRGNVTAALETFKTVGPFALLPVGLVLLFLNLLLGDWVWYLFGFLPIAFYALFFWIPLKMRWRSELALRLPGGRALQGREKRKYLLAASLMALFLADRMAGSLLSGWAMDQVYAAVEGWVIPWPWDWF